MTAITREEFAFAHPLRVRWSEVDAQQIVFNPNYLVYVDIAVSEYMREIGFPYPGGLARFGSDIFAVRSEVNWRDSALFDDELEIATRVSLIGRTSLTFTVGVFRRDILLCDVAIVYVNGDARTKAPTPIPEPFLAKVLAFEKTAPERKGAAPVGKGAAPVSKG